ncbi:aminotransferase, class I and II (plasmid) [Sinorhizobium americanum]|uniref:Aminotransferase, class I and II n=1 Tax=Sinorhizobium americanum TaxID=194963 RepID=A0A1L3LUE0_9HYPH|nr:aminotransferase, class I and II [Sinorhizobium americanum CCGM7]APG93676.1 aminotransferase, class I and II [Sinorhizobium americanum]
MHPRTEAGYRYDAAVFEAAIRPNTKIFILSNPHNPTGNVWTEDELRSMGRNLRPPWGFGPGPDHQSLL